MDFLKDNLETVRFYQPHIWSALRDVTPAAVRNNDVLIKDEKNQEFLYYDTTDPSVKCRKDIESLEQKHGDILKQSTAGYIIGFGLGLHTRQLLEKYPQIDRWYILEPQTEVLAAALSKSDLRSILANARIRFETGPELDMSTAIREDHVFASRKKMVFIFSSYDRRFPLYIKKFTINMVNAIEQRNIITATELEINKYRLKNTITNMRQIDSFCCLSDLSEGYKNQPIVCVAAGPSLDMNIKYLATLRDRVLIIACDAALAPCLQAGITPDIVTCSDYKKKQWELFFEGFEKELSKVSLITVPTVDPDLLKRYPGPKILVNTFAGWQYLQKYLQEKLGTVPHNNRHLPRTNVGMFSLCVANYLGADKIALVGQDLCYLPDKDYATGVTINKGYKGSLIHKTQGRGYCWKKEFANGKITETHIDFLINNNDSQVAVTKQFQFYLHEFEKILPTLTAKVYNCSSVGLVIGGAEYLSLEKFAGFLTEIKPLPLPAARLNDKTRLSSTLKELAENLRKVHENSIKDLTLPHSKSLKAFLEQSAKYNNELNILGEWDPRLLEYLKSRLAGQKGPECAPEVILKLIGESSRELIDYIGA